MAGSELDQQLVTLLSYVMVIMALAISASATLKQMVRLYQAQAWMLAVVVLLTSLEPDRIRLVVTVFALVPAALAVIVPPLLARASLTRPEPLWDSLRDAPARADLTWLQHGESRLRGGLSAVIDMMLIAIAVLVAYRLIQEDGTLSSEVAPSLAVTIALLLQGLFTMVNKRDIIAQIIGLLVIEHGLFLAAVRVAPSALAFLFVMSLFFYVLVTLTILLWILPELHRASMSIEVSDNNRLRG